MRPNPKNYLLIVFLVTSIHYFAQARDSYWSKVIPNKMSSENFSGSITDSKIFQLDLAVFEQLLREAPLRGKDPITSDIIIKLPNKEGIMESYNILEAPIMHPKLASKYPDIKSYIGRGIEDPAKTIRFSLSREKGLSASIFSGNGASTFIEPLDHNSHFYRVYSKSDIKKSELKCLTDDIPNHLKKSTSDKDANDQTLRIFRIAVSTTGHYTAYHGGTKSGAMAAINATLTRINGVFEKDFAIMLQLIPNNDTIVYEVAGTDPYTNNLNTQLQLTLTHVIGEANYDVGHLFDRNLTSGNAGCIGCVCVNGQKGSGVSRFANPEGYDFDIPLVAHELGHQFGANHTHTLWQETTGAQVEPASGSTIMGYAGIAGGGSDVQQAADDYFSFFNIQQVTNYISTTSCQVDSALGNVAPIVDAGGDYTIPRGTAFILEGSATDMDASDTLTYCWEQGDEGFNTLLGVNGNSSNGANFRSFPPTTSPKRYMPRLPEVINGNLTSQWETVSNVARVMNFALTVRDNSINGPQNSIDQMVVTVEDNSGPFVVTSQSTPVTWNEGNTVEITWDVANTTASPVSAANVDILLSLDSGYTYPITLATAVPNNGSAHVVVPGSANTTEGRIMVKGSGNIFYALNSADITINTADFIFDFVPSSDEQNICPPTDAVYTFTYKTFQGFNQVTTFSATGNPVGTTVTFNPATVQNNNTAVTVTISGITNSMTGLHNITLTGTAPSPIVTLDHTITLNVLSDTLTPTTLQSPPNGAADVTAPYSLSWLSDANATNYDIELATDNAFSNIIESVTGITTNSYVLTNTLSPNALYYWRVKPNNMCGNGSFSSVFSFSTRNCNTFNSIDVPINISPTSSSTITSTINVGTHGTITDVDVVNLTGTHTWVEDLTLTLTSPQGTSVVLWDAICGNHDDFDLNLDDNTAPGAIPCPPVGGGTYRPPDGFLTFFNGENPFGDWTLTVADGAAGDGGSLNSWDLNICLTSAIGISEISKGTPILIYPNPTSNFIEIDLLNENEVLDLSIWDLHGKLVKDLSHKIDQDKITVAMTHYSKGIYLLKVVTHDKTQTFKVVKR